MRAFWRIVGIGMLVAVLGSMTLAYVVSATDSPLKANGDKIGESDKAKKELWGTWKRLLVEVASEELGMSARDLWAELKAGPTIADTADAKGVDQQSLYDAYIVRLAEWLDEAVENGTISQSDADAMLDKMQGLGVKLLNKSWSGTSKEDSKKPLAQSNELWGACKKLLIDVVSEKLGMTAKDLYAELKAGKSIAGVANEQGVDPQTLDDAYMIRLAEWLDEAVEYGTISQSDAGAMLHKMQILGVNLLNGPSELEPKSK